MKYIKYIAALIFLSTVNAQEVEESKLGAWYMYFFNVQLEETSWGVQGDFQYRNWNTFGDIEQLLLRSGLTYMPKDSGLMFTLGYASITTATPNTSITVHENRIYQEALFTKVFFERIHTTHRFRYEQRWNEGQDFRTRFRYNIFINVLLNNTTYLSGTWYTAFYNELFVNGEREIGTIDVELFDRNRTYLGLGYTISKQTRVQLGVMRQTTDFWTKNQLQFSLHHNLKF